jgi:hypothetical protein
VHCQQRVELGESLRVEIVDRAVDGEHAGRFADAHHLLPGQLPVDVAGQRGQVADLP